jgi:hypothetical protein
MKASRHHVAELCINTREIAQQPGFKAEFREVSWTMDRAKRYFENSTYAGH